jgi:hypothetical protein
MKKSYSINGRNLPSWNQFYSGMHWAERKRIADEWHWIVREAVGSPDKAFDKPVCITITQASFRAAQDPDNSCDKLTYRLVVGLRAAWEYPSQVKSVTTRTFK